MRYNHAPEVVDAALPAAPFFFLRHGETAWNLRLVIQGTTDIGLNGRGQRQALEAAQTLEASELDGIITSPQLRAMQTAQIISHHLGVPILEQHADLRDRDFGALEGRPKPELLALVICTRLTQMNFR